MGTQRERAPVRTEVRWQDIGCPEQPGHHPFRESYVNVERRHIAVWKENPNAVFTAVRVDSEPIHYVIGGQVL